MTYSHDQAALVSELRDVRALLDLSYARERAAFSVINRAERLLEGAAIAPDREAELPEFRTALGELRTLVSSRPTPNHGLMVELAALRCELTAAKTVNQEIATENRRLLDQVAAQKLAISKLSAEHAEADAAWKAARQMFHDARNFDVTIQAAQELLRARRQQR